MNERIKELIEQATESKGFLTAGDSVKPLPVREFNKEKFAELIVRECADLFPMQFTDQQYQRRIDKTIRKHFGFE